MLVMVMHALQSCTPPPSILTLKDSDRNVFYPLLQRQVTHHHFTSYDGTSLSYTYLPNDTARFTVALIHGIAAHGLLYVPLADSLVAAGGAVYLLDIRGHGSSAGKPGHVPDDQTLARDARAFFKHVQSQNPRLPVVVVGHSLGTFIWQAAIAKFDEVTPTGAILLAGGMSPERMSRDLRQLTDQFVYLHKGSFLLSLLGFDSRPIEILLPEDSLLAAGHFNTRYTMRFLMGQNFTTEEYERWLERTREFSLLMVTGSEDEIMSVSALRNACENARGTDKTFKEIPESTHISIIHESIPVLNSWLRSRFNRRKE